MGYNLTAAALPALLAYLLPFHYRNFLLRPGLDLPVALQILGPVIVGASVHFLGTSPSKQELDVKTILVSSRTQAAALLKMIPIGFGAGGAVILCAEALKLLKTLIP